MRNPDRAKNVSSESTPPPVKYPACTEMANQIVKPRQPSSAGQCGLWGRVVALTSQMVRHHRVDGMLGARSVEHQDRDLLPAGRGLTGSAEPEATDVEALTR